MRYALNRIIRSVDVSDRCQRIVPRIEKLQRELQQVKRIMFFGHKVWRARAGQKSTASEFHCALKALVGPCEGGLIILELVL